MTVLRICLPVPLPPGPNSGMSIAPARLDAPTRELLALLSACRQDPPCPTVRGICQDAADRPARRVRGWLARLPEEPRAVGLVTLVTVHAGNGPRHSIGWLVVRPDVRRRGVATTLVRIAAAAVVASGGRALHVETLASWPAAAAFWSRLAAAARP